MGHRRVYKRSHKVRYEKRGKTNPNTEWDTIAILSGLFLLLLVIITFSGNLLSNTLLSQISPTSAVSIYNPPYRSGSGNVQYDKQESDIIDPESIGDANLIAKANSISMVVPVKGNSLLGTTGSMKDMYTWQLDSGYQLIKGFTETMSLLGLQDQDYVVNMQTNLYQGMSLANKNWINK